VDWTTFVDFTNVAAAGGVFLEAGNTRGNTKGLWKISVKFKGKSM